MRRWIRLHFQENQLERVKSNSLVILLLILIIVILLLSLIIVILLLLMMYILILILDQSGIQKQLDDLVHKIQSDDEINDDQIDGIVNQLIDMDTIKTENRFKKIINTNNNSTNSSSSNDSHPYQQNGLSFDDFYNLINLILSFHQQSGNDSLLLL